MNPVWYSTLGYPVIWSGATVSFLAWSLRSRPIRLSLRNQEATVRRGRGRGAQPAQQRPSGATPFCQGHRPYPKGKKAKRKKSTSRSKHDYPHLFSFYHQLAQSTFDRAPCPQICGLYLDTIKCGVEELAGTAQDRFLSNISKITEHYQWQLTTKKPPPPPPPYLQSVLTNSDSVGISSLVEATSPTRPH